MHRERAAQLVNEMSPAQAADILAILPSSEADELLKLMDRTTVAKVQQIVDKHDENILLYATQDYIKLPPETLAKEVIEIVAAEHGETLAQIMTDHVISLATSETLRDATRMFDRYGFRTIPVCSGEEQLVGVVSFWNIRGIKPRLD